MTSHRYYDTVVDEMGLSVAAIVYIPKNTYKAPDLKFDGKYLYKDSKVKDKVFVVNNYSEDIRRKLVILPAITKSKQDLAHLILDKCIELADNETGRVYLKEYSNLLKSFGGVHMYEDQLKLFKLVANDFKMEQLKNLSSIWTNIENIYAKKLFDLIVNNNDSTFIENGEVVEIIEENIHLQFGKEYYEVENIDGKFYIQFYKSSGKLGKEEKEIFRNKLQNYTEKLCDGFRFDSVVGNDDHTVWVYCSIDSREDLYGRMILDESPMIEQILGLADWLKKKI